MGPAGSEWVSGIALSYFKSTDSAHESLGGGAGGQGGPPARSWHEPMKTAKHTQPLVPKRLFLTQCPRHYCLQLQFDSLHLLLAPVHESESSFQGDLVSRLLGSF